MLCFLHTHVDTPTVLSPNIDYYLFTGFEFKVGPSSIRKRWDLREIIPHSINLRADAECCCTVLITAEKNDQSGSMCG